MYQDGRFQQPRRNGKPAPKGDPAQAVMQVLTGDEQPRARTFGAARADAIGIAGSLKLK